MHPANLFSLFPPLPREEKVFVAMSFDNEFDDRWLNVIEPTIKNIIVNEIPLEPVRVDARKVSDSILTEIITGISSSRLIFVDITTIGYIENKSKSDEPKIDKPIRNNNVMYELGMAHSVRLPEEVIIFRSDNDPLPFDTANIRVNWYDPDNDKSGAITKIEEAIFSALKEIELRKHLAVKKAVESLDEPSYWLLIEMLKGAITHPQVRSVRDSVVFSSRISSINKLLELEAIKSVYLSATPESINSDENKDENLLKYQITEFGITMINECAAKMGLKNPEVVKALKEKFEGEG